MNQFLVRPSTEDDLSDIARIYGHHVLHGSATFELDTPSRDEMAARRSAMVDTARATQFPLPLSAAAHQMFMMAAAAGHGREDDSAVIKIFPGISLPGPVT